MNEKSRVGGVISEPFGGRKPYLASCKATFTFLKGTDGPSVASNRPAYLKSNIQRFSLARRKD